MRNIKQNQYIFFIFLFLFVILRANTCFAEFTIDDEKKVGKEFYDEIVKHHLLVENKKLNNYISQIGNLILQHSKKAPFEYHFLIINSSAINAFATPGGYIYINKGLINAVENEGELAGVIAHEIGHANGRHVADLVEKSKKINIATLAAVLAGVFLGGGGAASAAIPAFAIAGSSSLSLKYIREHEEEADRMGLDYLVSAGYYPAAMIDFMKIMKKYEFLSKNMPSYLLTHPGTDERIFYLESMLLTKYRQGGARHIIGNLSRMQALLTLDIDDLNSRHKQLEDSLAKDSPNVDLLYAIGLTEDKMGLTSEALEHYQKALDIAPRDEDVLINLGLINLKLGKADQAQIYLQRALDINSDNSDVLLALGKSYDALGKYRNALDCYLKLEDKSFEDTDIHYYIAMAYGKINNQGEFHYNFGLYLKKMKKKDSALFHFKEANNFFPPGSVRAETIAQEIKALNEPKTPSKSSPKNSQKNSFGKDIKKDYRNIHEDYNNFNLSGFFLTSTLQQLILKHV